MLTFSEDDFWKLIPKTPPVIEDDRELVEYMVSRLALQPVEHHWAFFRVLMELMVKCHTAEISSAAHFMNGGGGGDDGFEYFRGWLIMQGKENFYKVLQDTDYLAELVHEPISDFEPILYVAVTAFQLKTGRSMDEFYDNLGDDIPTDPDHEWSDFFGEDDDVLKLRLPKLYQKVMEIKSRRYGI